MASEEKGAIYRIVDWIDSRFGFSRTILRPAPRYSLSPTYWLGAIAFVVFLLQGVTGILMMQYYVPSPDKAYESTMQIVSSVSYGLFIETVHLYGAYAMIFLAFLHLVRGYFVGVYKRPRELMWIVGMVMGLAALAMGFTGYLLPWTVISKSAVDVSIGLINNLPDPIRGMIVYIIAGTGSDEELLIRFFSFHVVVLPVIIILCFAIKLHMFEVHGASEPLSEEADKREVKWFPDVLVYLLMLSFVFLSVLFAISAIFPVEFPPKFSPEVAAQYAPQPEWYFLWMYQILKIPIFEGKTGVQAALALIMLIALVVTFLPFIDRSEKRNPMERPFATTIGVIAVVEIVILTIWGALTPGKGVSLVDAIIILGLPILIIGLISRAVYLRYQHVKALRMPKKFAWEFVEASTSSNLLLFFAMSFFIAVGSCSISMITMSTNLFSAIMNTISLITSIIMSVWILYSAEPRNVLRR